MSRRSTISVWFVFIFLCLVGGLASAVLASQGRGTGIVHASAETVVFRQGEDGYAGCEDTRISEEKPNSNFGDEELVLGMKGRASILIRFDVSSIPANAVVLEAAVSLFAANGGQVTPIVAGAYSVVRSWQEMEATWYQATSTDAWGLPGCNHTVTDRAATPLDTAALYGRDQWYTWDVRQAVQQWVQDPDANEGLLIQQTNLEVGGEFDIRQSEYTGLDVRPFLEVRYTLVPPTPTQPAPTELPPCVGTPEPGAVLTVLQQGVGYSGAEDTMFDFDDRETSYAGEWYMRVGYRKHYSGLIKYDVSSIPAGSRIVCAALSLFAERWSGGPAEIGAYHVKRENSIHDATWTWAAPGVAWQEGGCNGPDDRQQTPESVVVVHSIYGWHHLDLTRVVDGWVNGTLANNGVSLQAVDRLDDDTVWFTASDDATVANRPRLAVLFVPPPGWVPTATPTPTITPTPTATPTPTPTSGPPLTSTLQNGLEGYAGCSDTRISAEAPMFNFGESELKAGARQQIAALVQFDLSTIPSGAQIESAYLQVYGYHREGDTSIDLGTFAVKRVWAEDEASWSGATQSTSWGMPGCNDVLTDRAESATFQVTIDSAGWHSWAVTDDVQRMVSEPATNAGWVLMQAEAVPGVVAMYSSEYGNATLRPKLVVTYTLP